MVKLLSACVACVKKTLQEGSKCNTRECNIRTCNIRTECNLRESFRSFLLYPVELLVNVFEGQETTEMKCAGAKEGYCITDLDGDEATKKKQKRRIIKNLLVLTVVFVLVFVAYNGLSSLQSVLFPAHSLGTLCQGITYFSYVISSVFLPRIFIVKFGQKWSIMLCTMGYMTWMAANGVADWYTLGITSAIVGLAAAPLWTSQASYITKYATLYARLNNEEPQHVIARFFGIFGAIFGTSKIFSSLSAAYILTPAAENMTLSVGATEADLLMCGRNDCPLPSNATQHNQNFHKVDPVVLWTLVAVYLLTATVAILLAGFLLDPVPDKLQDPVSDTSTIFRETLELLTATLRLLVTKEMIVMIPLIMTPGMDFAFFNADWARSYITCAVGISYVGWTTFPQGAISIPIQIIGGLITKPFGRMPLIIGGQLILLAVNIIQLAWMPRPDQMWVFYFVSLLYGVAGIGGPAKEGLIGSEFNDCTDAAFSNIHVWGSLGGSMAFAYSTYLCIQTKLYILIFILILGIFGYIIAEVWFKRRASTRSRKQHDNGSPMTGTHEDEVPLMEQEGEELQEVEQEHHRFKMVDGETETEMMTRRGETVSDEESKEEESSDTEIWSAH